VSRGESAPESCLLCYRTNLLERMGLPAGGGFLAHISTSKSLFEIEQDLSRSCFFFGRFWKCDPSDLTCPEEVDTRIHSSTRDALRVEMPQSIHLLACLSSSSCIFAVQIFHSTTHSNLTNDDYRESRTPCYLSSPRLFTLALYVLPRHRPLFSPSPEPLFQ
jgi:hypothetical protein